MPPAIAASLISGGISLVGIIVTIIIFFANQKKEQTKFATDLFARLDKSQAVTDTKIDELTREVREHNNFARRVPVMEEQIKVVNNRIADLEAAGTRMQTQIIDGYSHR